MARVRNAKTAGGVNPRVQFRRGASGFTLAEMLIVVLILGIVALTTVPLIGTALQEARLSRATVDVVSALEYARAGAAATGADFQVRFPDGAGIVVVEQRVPNTDIEASDLIPEALIENGIFEPVPHPVDKHTNAFAVVTQEDGFPKIVSADFGGTNGVIFGNQGIPSSAGEVELAFGRYHRTVKLNGQTGRTGVGE